MAKRGGLGRGLDALIPTRGPEKDSGKSSGKAKKGSVSGAEKGSKSTKEAKASKPAKTAKASPAREAEKPAKTPTAKASAVTAGGSRAKGSAGASKASAARETAKAVKASATTEAAAPVVSGVSLPSDGQSVVSLKISLVEPNREQPRKYFDDEAIAELSDSIKQFGVISPLLVQKKDGYYEIIAGERRWRAAKKAGLKELPVIIKDYSGQEAVEVSLIENIQREDLNPIEEAKAYGRLAGEYGLSQEDVAKRVSKSRSAVANSIRLLKLTDEVQKMVETGELTEGHARALLGADSPELEKAAAAQIVKEKLSVRQTEKLIKDLASVKKKPRKTSAEKERENLLNTLAENLREALGTKVSIRQSGRNKGRIEIEYYSDDELDRLYELLRDI